MGKERIFGVTAVAVSSVADSSGGGRVALRGPRCVAIFNARSAFVVAAFSWAKEGK